MKKKYDWKNMDYIDYPFMNLLGKQSQLKKYIRGRTEKMDDIDKQILKLQKQKKEHKLKIMIWNGELNEVNKVIEQTTKVQKSNDSITLMKTDKYIRGKVRLYGVNKWIHIGSLHKSGIVNPNKVIGKMNDNELCDEFRYKLGVQVGKGKLRFFSDSYMNKRKKKQLERKELRDELKQKLKEGKITQVKGDDKTQDFKSTTSSKGMSKQQRRRYK
jgi:hypothetical protein